MNERIKELSLQASESIPDDVSAEHAMYLFQKKFAELMVKKFDDILILEQLDCIGNMDKKSVLLLDKIRERTKTYFGIEE